MTPEEALDRLRTGRLPRTATLNELATEWKTSEPAAKKRLQRWDTRGQLVCAWTGGGLITLSLPASQRDRDSPGDRQAVPQGQPLSVKGLAPTEAQPTTPQSNGDRGLAVLLGQPPVRRGQVRDTGDNVVAFTPRSHNALAIDTELQTRMQELAEQIRPVRQEVQPAPAPPERDTVSAFVVSLSGLIGLVLAACALAIDTEYGMSFSTPLAGLALVANLTVIVSPMVGEVSWKRRRWWWLATAVISWLVMAPIAVMSSLGYAAIHADRASAEGAQAATTFGVLQDRIKVLRRDLTAITEGRSVEEINKAADRTLGKIDPAVVARTNKCLDVTQAKSASACDPVLKVYEMRGTAERRDSLQRELDEKTATLASTRAVNMADAMPPYAADLAQWAGWQLQPRDFQNGRVLFWALAPHVAGLLFIAPIGYFVGRRRRIDPTSTLNQGKRL